MSRVRPRLSIKTRYEKGAVLMKWGRSFFAPWRTVIFVSIAVSPFCLVISPAAAQFYVRSPDVTKGELAIEEYGAAYSGPGEEERRRQSHEVELKYGFTDRELEIGAQYEIIERKGDGLGLAFRGIYEFALQDHSPDEILFGPLAKYVIGRDSATINTFFVGQLGDDAEIDSLELKVNWRLKHELGEKFALGIEGYSEIEDLAHAGTFDDQKHRLRASRLTAMAKGFVCLSS